MLNNFYFKMHLQQIINTSRKLRNMVLAFGGRLVGISRRAGARRGRRIRWLGGPSRGAANGGRRKIHELFGVRRRRSFCGTSARALQHVIGHVGDDDFVGHVHLTEK